LQKVKLFFALQVEAAQGDTSRVRFPNAQKAKFFFALQVEVAR